MIPHHIYYQLAIVGLLWLCVMLHSVWPSRGAVPPQPPMQPVPPPLKRKRSNELTPFVGSRTCWLRILFRDLSQSV